MKLSFKSLFNVLKFGGAYTSAAVTCLLMSLGFYYVVYMNKGLRDVTLYGCAAILSLSCCIVLMSIVVSSYMRKIIEDMTAKNFRKNNETTNLFNFLYKMCRVFTLAGCVVVLATGLYMVTYPVISTI